MQIAGFICGKNKSLSTLFHLLAEKQEALWFEITHSLFAIKGPVLGLL
jgi:hypothetical protein